ncbi:phage tail tape measure protein [Pseudomonas sp. MWU13-3659]|uniref:phage tail tape measure protein n=1 Tax=Pseudomonas sp. MWU13-3659 TaxID=2986964 RepID=UPI002074DBBC|nr:phage tail tape measure protein [Pseudomonas sp. MWU13-3659]
MAKLAIALEIGGAVAASLGAAFGTAKGHIKKLEDTGSRAKVLKNTIGETIKLRDEWKKAHDSGSAAAAGLLRKLDGNLSALKKQGVEVGRLAKEYQRLGREAKAADLQQKGRQQIDAGKSSLKSSVGAAVVGVGAAAIPTKISADYQAIIRDIAIKSNIVNKPEEAQLSRTVIDTARETGMSRNDVADLVNQLVGAGMEVEKALAYAPTAAKFAIGQGSSGVDTAAMIQALQQNAKITDPKVMQQALEAIAYQGQAGSFEAADMAKWFPQLLAGMEKGGVTGLDAVTSLGAMLQVQMKTAGSSDEAANNFKNWMEKIGAGDIQKNYEKVGIDYQKSLNTGLQKGMNVFEASMGLAMQYVEKTDPKKALAMKEAQAKIDKEVDPQKATAALEALERSLRTGDVFADMQVKAALTAYAQNRGLYATLKADSADAKKVAGILDKNLAERRETSKQRWTEAGQSVDDAMRSVGDAIRPITDQVAQGISRVAQEFTRLSDGSQTVVAGAVALGGALLGLKTAFGAFKLGKGMLNLLRGNRLARGGSGEVQKVFVTNSDGKGDGDGDGEEGGRNKFISLLQKGVKVATGRKDGEAGDGDGDGEGSASGPGAVDVGLSLLDLFRSEKGEGDDESSEPQKVFVVNSADFGGAGGGEGDRRRRRGGRRGRRGGAGGGPGGRGGSGSRGAGGGRRAAPPPPPVPPTPPRPPGRVASILGRVSSLVPSAGEAGLLGKTVGLVGKVAKRLPGGNVADAAFKVFETATTAQTQDEKAEGYGQAAGGLAGSMAGAAAGAAIGSVVPIIGTAIGGLIGGVLGGIGGEELGGFLGLKMFGSGDEADKTGQDKAASPGDVARSIAAAAPAPTAPVVAQALEQAKPSGGAGKVDQSFAFSPTNTYTIQGDVKDPAQLARDLEPFQRAQFDSWWREMSARQSNAQLFDEAHV